MQPPVQLLHKRPQSFSLGRGDFLGGGAVHTFCVFVCNVRTCKLYSLPAGRNCVGTFFRKPKNMPVDGASYLVGRTDKRYYEKEK